MKNPRRDAEYDYVVRLHRAWVLHFCRDGIIDVFETWRIAAFRRACDQCGVYED